MKLVDFLASARDRLKAETKLQCADPALHALQIAADAMGVTLSELYLRWEAEISSENLAKAEKFLSRRIGGEPFQYIVGQEGFWKDDFAVGPGVLIPRRETELIVEILLKELKGGEKIGELGAGSGNIGISVTKEISTVSWVAFEKSEKALQYTRKNVEALKTPDSYQIIAGNFFDKAEAFAPFDWMVSNPPYVSIPEMATLPIEVIHEPTVALEAGEDGLMIIRKLADSAQKWLKPGGKLVFEIGSSQGAAVQSLLAEKGFHEVSIVKDLAGLDRVARGTK